MNKNPIRVLVAEDSPVERELLLHILQADPEIRVVSVAADGVQAVEAACRERPDVVTMDVHMPNMDGLEATRQIMETCPAPIVVVSASSGYSREGAKAFEALEAGALALARKPPGVGQPGYGAAVQELLQTLKLMSEVKVVRRWRRPGVARPLAQPPKITPHAPIQLVAIGASAGGPPALQHILAALPKDFPVPLLIVQHMASGFVEGFTGWLRDSTGFPVQVAVHGAQPLPGHVYVAPCGTHLAVANSGLLRLADDPPEGGLRPAVSALFRSVAEACGERAVGVLLTGMGRDGAAELKQMKDSGAITIAQDEETSVVFGMPGEAVRLGAATYVLPLERIAAMLSSISGREGAR